MSGPRETTEEHDAMHEALLEWGRLERQAAGTSPARAAHADKDRRRGWPVAVAAAVTAAVAVALGVALFAPDDARRTPAVGQPTPTPNATASENDELTLLNGPLSVTPVDGANPRLSRRQAEVVMLNSWAPPPLDATAVHETVGPVRVGLAEVRLAPEVRRVNGEVPERLSLAWVVEWTTGDGSRACPTPGTAAPHDPTTRQNAYVLAADGTTAYSFTGASESCQTQQQAPELATARVQRAVDRVSVPWDGSRRDANGDVLMSFERPVCATAGGLFRDQGQMIFVEIPVGTGCEATVKDSIRTGPTEPAHDPLLGPIRMRNGVALPALKS